MIVYKLCLVLYLFMTNIVPVGMKRKRHSRLRFRCSDFLHPRYTNTFRREYALYVEEIPEALVYNFPDRFMKEDREWTKDSRTTTALSCRNLHKSSRCHTRIDLDYNPNRYPDTIFQTRCCRIRNFGEFTCENAQVVKHVLVKKYLNWKRNLSRRTRRRGWCTFKRDIQIISVRCKEEIHTKCGASGSYPKPPAI